MKTNALERLLLDFYTVCGMELSVLDAKFHTVAMVKSKGVHVCSLLHRLEGAGSTCKASDIQHLNEVRSTLTPVLYTCPFGMTEAIVPVIRGERIIAYLISTMGVNTDRPEDADLLEQTAVGHPAGERLRGAVRAQKHLTEAQLQSHLRLLSLLGEHISNDETLFFERESLGQWIKTYVKNNLHRRLTLEDMASHLHCSTVTLTEHFKSEFGMTIMAYVVRKRMQLSERLLITTSLPLREVAARAGFADVEYFSRTFKKFHGISPAAWRRQEAAGDLP